MKCSCGSRKAAATSGCGYARRLRSDKMTKVAAVVRADNAAEAERQSRMALEKGADLVELRLDYARDLGSSTIRKLANGVGARAIATLRSPGQGGAPGPNPRQRIAFLREICHSRFAYVDLELETDREVLGALGRLASDHRTVVIVSHHFAHAVEAHRVSEALDSCAAQGKVAKVAVPVTEVDTAIQLVDLARSGSGRPIRGRTRWRRGTTWSREHGRPARRLDHGPQHGRVRIPHLPAVSRAARGRAERPRRRCRRRRQGCRRRPAPGRCPRSADKSHRRAREGSRGLLRPSNRGAPCRRPNAKGSVGPARQRDPGGNERRPRWPPGP